MRDEVINTTRAWDKEKSESQIGIEPMTFRAVGGRSILCPMLKSCWLFHLSHD